MGKHRNPFISDEASDERPTEKRKIAKSSSPDIQEPLFQNRESPDDNGSYKAGNGKMHYQKLELKVISPEKKTPLPDIQLERNDNSVLAFAEGNKKTKETNFQEENSIIEALMLDTKDVLADTGVSRSIITKHIDKTSAEVYGEQLQGGLTIVYVNYRNSNESAYVMQAVTAISRNIGSIPSLGVIHIATRALESHTNKAKLNMDSYKQHIFVMVNKHCPKLRESNGLIMILKTFASWLNTHTFSKKKGLVEEKSFCNYTLGKDSDRTGSTSRRKLADIILLTEAIAIVQDLFPSSVERNTLKTQILPAYFSLPYPEEMRDAFNLISKEQE